MKWIAVVATVLAALCWLANGYWGVGWCGGRGGMVTVYHGVLRVGYFKGDLFGSFFLEWPRSEDLPPTISFAFFGATPPYSLDWQFVHRPEVYFGSREVGIPLWFPVAMLVGIAGIVWRWDAVARRRERIGKCAQCGYDRAGIGADAKCPECGAMPPGIG